MSSKNIAIVGAGITGISLGRMLAEDHNVTIFEASDQIGGLIKCKDVNGNLYHLVGGHVFNSKNEEVLNWFWSFFDKDNEFNLASRKAQILLNGRYVDYPIEYHIYQLEQEKALASINDLKQQLASGNTASATTFGEFLHANFGPTLFDCYFRPYNEKIWKTDLYEMPLEWLDGKLPMPNHEEILQKNILRSTEVDMVHSSFYYPIKGGSQHIIDRLAQGLEIETQHPVKSIGRNGEKYSIDEHPDEFDAVVYTGDIRKLPAVLPNTIPGKLAELLSTLESNGTSNVLCECDKNDLSWLYLPDTDVKCHRIIYTGNFSEENSNCPDGRSTCVVEFSGTFEEQEMHAEIEKLPGNLKPIASNLSNASYVIQNKESRQIINKVKETLGSQQFFIMGRFAEWEYYNMDKCMEASLNLTKTINKVFVN